MHTSWDVVGAFFVALIVSYGFTPLVRKLAFKLNALDHPEKKKAHVHPTPLLGGVVIYMAFLASVIFSIEVDRVLLGIFIGATMLLLLGLVDDKIGMMPQLKLCVQGLAALTVFKFGLHVVSIEDYYLSMAFTIFWIVGITNAFNLLDNLNGLSSGIAVISSAFIAAMAFFDGDYLTATLACGIAGSCMGFLKYNFPKASIFMGDSGSLVLGFLLASVAIMGSWETEKISLSVSIPIIIFGYAIFDTALVTVIRLREKRSIFQGGKDHSSHILAFVGLKKKRAVLLIFAISFFLGISALVIKFAPTAAGGSTLGITALAMGSFGLRLLYLRKKMIRMKDAKQKKY
ncbi:MAG: undecaprenyl/decaprenyl-phosphate alpha-N-acetylglucosaminyl 1-phosphate transferase [Omnitrophica bacterium]|nr:undecaprenyl/decaprenyl-phosphate alpha-N-acetylglucosaminyl 1-phosphate transferase [Candidatus Omnitrophota bacterium]